MQPGNPTDDMFPTNNQDFDMFGPAAAGECESCKGPCTNVATDPETYDMAFESYDTLDMNLMGMHAPFALYSDAGVILINPEGHQQLQHDFPEPSTWEMDLVSAFDEEMAISQFVDPFMPEYSNPHYGSFFPLSQQGQDVVETYYRPREPFAAADFPQPIVAQDDCPPSWHEGLFPESNGATTIDQINESAGIYHDPLDHEQWASTGVSPGSMSQQYAELLLCPEEALPEMEMTLGTPILDSFSHHDTYQHDAEGHQQCLPTSTPTSTSNHDADWADDETYRGIPLQARDMSFCALLQLNDSFADLVYLQWREVAEEHIWRPCRDIFADYPTIRGLATMFNLRMSEDEDADGEEEEEEQGAYTSSTHEDNEEDEGCDSEDHASVAATAGELDDDVEMRD
ncbi:hypothetical protein PG985_014987 [Apiospora marii]|uniref:uncharacterized protein n=1 Tax=Apiospora marii TaxID=335849 RepID=UPI0031323529